MSNQLDNSGINSEKKKKKSNDNTNKKKSLQTKRKQLKKKRKKRKTAVSSTPNIGKRSLLFLWNLLFYTVMLSLLIGSGLMAVMQQQDKSLNGYRMFGVLTNSMVSPDNTLKPGGFRAGDILIVKEVPGKEIKVGDVITYRPSTNPTNKSNNNLTHRVVKINDHLGEEEGLFFVTRGDANKTDDMPISANALVGKEVFSIPKLGGLLAFIKENWLISLIFIVSILGFIWVIRIYIISAPKKSRKKKDRRGITSSEVNINKNTQSRRRKHT